MRYVVRQEFGVQDRGIYAIAKLADPGGWNHKLLTYFGASTAPDHLQSQPSAVLDDMALSRGFMTANSSLNVHGQNTNENVSAEALMMLKEHIVETYGRIRYTIGQGCSGGSYQYMIAAMYPGLLNGIQPNCSYTDLWTTAPDVMDCGLIAHYFEANPHQPWVPVDRRPPGPERLRRLGRALLQHAGPGEGRQLQAARRPGLRPGGQAARRPLQHPGLPGGDLGTAAQVRVGAGGEADRQGLREPAVGQRGRAVRPEGPRVG